MVFDRAQIVDLLRVEIARIVPLVVAGIDRDMVDLEAKEVTGENEEAIVPKDSMPERVDLSERKVLGLNAIQDVIVRIGPRVIPVKTELRDRRVTEMKGGMKVDKRGENKDLVTHARPNPRHLKSQPQQVGVIR